MAAITRNVPPLCQAKRGCVTSRKSCDLWALGGSNSRSVGHDCRSPQVGTDLLHPFDIVVLLVYLGGLFVLAYGLMIGSR